MTAPAMPRLRKDMQAARCTSSSIIQGRMAVQIHIALDSKRINHFIDKYIVLIKKQPPLVREGAALSSYGLS